MESEDYINDYRLHSINGILFTEKSILKQQGDYTFISVYSQIIMIHTLSGEIKAHFGTTPSQISSFYLTSDEKLIIGYESGTIEIFDSLDFPSSLKFKIHYKQILKINEVKLLNDSFIKKFITTSSDNTVCIFDYQLLSSKYIKLTNKIINAIFNNDYIFIATADKTVRIYNLDGEECDILIFEEYIRFFSVYNNNELFIIYENGKSNIVDYSCRIKGKTDLSNIYRPFFEFNRIISFSYSQSKFIVYCKKKIFLFTALPKIKLLKVEDAVDNLQSLDFYNNTFIGLSRMNSLYLGKKEISLNFHSSNIIQLKVFNNQIFSLCKDKLNIWWYKDDDVEAFPRIISSVNLKSEALCFSVIEDQILVGTKNFLIRINRDTLTSQIVKQGQFKHLIYFNKTIMAVENNRVNFYNLEMDLIKTINPPEAVITATISSNHLVAISCIDSKIYLYNYSDLSQKLVFYGHSLPVKFLEFSPDNALLSSCGSDKLIKFWSTEFGDCRKSLIGDSKNISFLSNSLYFYSNGNLCYNKKFDILKKFPTFTNNGLVEVGNNCLIYTVGAGFILFNKKDTELNVDDLDKEDLGLIVTKESCVASVDKYETFFSFIERIEEGDLQLQKSFFDFLLSVELLEILEYLNFLDSFSVEIILNTLETCYEKNVVFAVKLFIKLFTLHQYDVIAYNKFEILRNKLLYKLAEVKAKVGNTCFKLNLSNNFNE